MKKILDLFLSDFEWYRKKSGGKWKKIETSDESGWSSSDFRWIRDNK